MKYSKSTIAIPANVNMSAGIVHQTHFRDLLPPASCAWPLAKVEVTEGGVVVALHMLIGYRRR